MDFKSSGKAFSLKIGFKPRDLPGPALKRMVKVEAFPGALKRSFPRINAGAPTRDLTPWVSAQHCSATSSGVQAKAAESGEALVAEVRAPRRIQSLSSMHR